MRPLLNVSAICTSRSLVSAIFRLVSSLLMTSSPSSLKSRSTSNNAHRLIISSRISPTLPARRPLSCSSEARCALLLVEAINDATASARERSIFPFRNARRVNSPGSACRQPASRMAPKTFCVTSTPPWQLISTESSPVYECGPRKTVASTSSISSPCGEAIRPW